MPGPVSTGTKPVVAARSRTERVLDGLRTLVINLLYTALVAVVGYSLVVTYKLKKYETWQKSVEVAEAQHKLTEDVDTNDELKHEIAFLRTSEGAEKVARDRLGLIRPNEATFVVVNAPAAHRQKAHSPPPPPTEPPPGEPIVKQVWHILCEVWNGGE